MKRELRRKHDLLYRDKAYAAEADYVALHIRKRAPDSKRILELGCETGIHAEKLAALGYSVHGIDLSAEMLKCAEDRLRYFPEKEAKRLSFSCGDIRQFRYGGGLFDAVISLFIREKSTGNMEMLEETHKMRYLFKPEIEQILALSGLSLINGQEWLSGNELDFSTWNGCFIAENK